MKDIELNIVINPSSRCSMRCAYCFFLKNNIFINDISFEQICEKIQIIEKKTEKLQIEKRRIRFNALDAMFVYKAVVNPTILKFKNRFQIYFNSNGILLNQNILQDFLDNNVKISVSLDGPKYIQDINRFTVNNRSTFNIVVKNLTKAINSGIDLQVNSTFNFYSIDYIYDSYLYHMENPLNYKFNFNFDKFLSDRYSLKFLLLKKQFKKIAEHYCNCNDEQKKKFLFINLALYNKNIDCLSFNLSSKYTRIVSNSNSNSNSNIDINDIDNFNYANIDQYLYNQKCLYDSEQCLTCPIFKNYGKFHTKLNFNVSCLLYKEIFNLMKGESYFGTSNKQ